MGSYIIRRLLLVVPMLLAITFLVFVIVHLAPGDPTNPGLEGDQGLSAEKTIEYREAMRKLYGLDKPLHVQYLKWIRNLLVLDFGRSYIDQQLITKKIGERLPLTLSLNICALIIIYVVSIPIGVFAAVKQNTLVDRLLTLVLFILYSLPIIWVGTMLLLLLSHWFPLGGMNSPGHEQMTFFTWLGDRMWHMVLPVITMTYAGFASLSRYMRSGMLEVIRKDYIRTARAKGLREWTVVIRHALRNSLIPMVTISVMALPGLIGGSVIVESLFNINGVGKLSLDAVFSRDYFTVMALTTFSAGLVLLCLILGDILYAVVDPRISHD